MNSINLTSHSVSILSIEEQQAKELAQYVDEKIAKLSVDVLYSPNGGTVEHEMLLTKAQLVKEQKMIKLTFIPNKDESIFFVYTNTLFRSPTEQIRTSLGLSLRTNADNSPIEEGENDDIITTEIGSIVSNIKCVDSKIYGYHLADPSHKIQVKITTVSSNELNKVAETLKLEPCVLKNNTFRHVMNYDVHNHAGARNQNNQISHNLNDRILQTCVESLDIGIGLIQEINWFVELDSLYNEVKNALSDEEESNNTEDADDSVEDLTNKIQNLDHK